ncbi:Probable RNA-directed DNA polymerase from transposon X-element [Eumeta japonica]|uniref:Probable RNA-directed DNA polymerase from transposon X-element n=1 Tax=Eumeta variegata TaxID=151549 RepID=A0A4C1Y0V3_EUMVA|nr:Probable RNA-directed DNA polymerase from transposon X-element [Eumeta japonica]
MGKFLGNWKTAAVTPLHKGCPKDDPNTYRPITFLHTLSKLLEGLVNVRPMAFLKKHGLLSKMQIGFRKNKLTEYSVSLLVENIPGHFDKRRACFEMFMDLAKVFDILLRKLKMLEVRGLRSSPPGPTCATSSKHSGHGTIESPVYIRLFSVLNNREQVRSTRIRSKTIYWDAIRNFMEIRYGSYALSFRPHYQRSHRRCKLVVCLDRREN